ncbi:MAG TPA: hypothetical protein VFN77_11725 [Acetobacteraceae bacterium]|nr:hypothetical protein [Acetobacteraceae bacterium]
MCAGLAGCALETPSPSTGYLPASAFGGAVIGEDPSMAAANDAAWVFAHPGRMQGQPAQMAMGIASLDAMAGQFSTSPRWERMDALVKLQMLRARSRVRRILGVRPGAPSQAVIDALVAAARALHRGDERAALTALSAPVFIHPPRRSLALLAHFPYVPLANHATAFASQYLYPGGGVDQGTMD